MMPEENPYVAIRGSVPFDAGIAHVETELAEIRAVEERLQMLVELLRSEQPNDPMFMPIGELMREEELLQDGVESIDVEKHFRRFAELVEELSDGSLSQNDAGKMSSADVLLWFSERMLERCSEMEAQISRIAEKGERIGYVPGWSTTGSMHFGAQDSLDADTVLELLSQQECSQRYALTASMWPVNVKLIVIGSRKLIRKAKKADGEDTITLEIEEVEAMLTNTCQAKEDLAGKNCIFVRI